jgi:hypothetical protein
MNHSYRYAHASVLSTNMITGRDHHAFSGRSSFFLGHSRSRTGYSWMQFSNGDEYMEQWLNGVSDEYSRFTGNWTII